PISERKMSTIPAINDIEKTIPLKSSKRFVHNALIALTHRMTVIFTPFADFIRATELATASTFPT
ncbi:MAG: hypothetical protein WCK96_15330, partial [Methylococcales bacterium]